MITLYKFVKNLIIHLKYKRLIEQVYKDEDLINKFSQLFNSEFRMDYVGRMYAVLNPNINDQSLRYLDMSFEHPFGTDGYGNDVFDAVWAGTRTSLFISFVVTTITTVIGTIVGMFWGYSKKMDVIMIEIYNVIANIPFTLLVKFWQLIFSLFSFHQTNPLCKCQDLNLQPEDKIDLQQFRHRTSYNLYFLSYYLLLT